MSIELNEVKIQKTEWDEETALKIGTSSDIDSF